MTITIIILYWFRKFTDNLQIYFQYFVTEKGNELLNDLGKTGIRVTKVNMY